MEKMNPVRPGIAWCRYMLFLLMLAMNCQGKER